MPYKSSFGTSLSNVARQNAETEETGVAKCVREIWLVVGVGGCCESISSPIFASEVIGSNLLQSDNNASAAPNTHTSYASSAACESTEPSLPVIS